jgi:LPXTG-site transpeptidase (sortase) family protein
MGKASKIFKGRHRAGLYLLVAAGLVLGALFLGTSIFGTGAEPVKKAATPVAAPAPEPLVNEALVEARARAAGQVAREAAEKEVAKRAAREQARREDARKKAAEQASAQEPAVPATIPPDTTMYLTVPKLGLFDVPVLEDTSEAVLSQGVGHVPGTGYPWAADSNTYIAGHRLGYPGTVSDHIFWQLPSLVAGDQIIVEDSLGQSYTYRVSEILEVYPTDLSVMAPVGRDVVALQTCIESFGDYWTPGPNWLARYIVRGERVR